jgi:hypothetical protein
MADTDLIFLSVAQQAQRIRSRSVSPREPSQG